MKVYPAYLGILASLTLILWPNNLPWIFCQASKPSTTMMASTVPDKALASTGSGQVEMSFFHHGFAAKKNHRQIFHMLKQLPYSKMFLWGLKGISTAAWGWAVCGWAMPFGLRLLLGYGYLVAPLWCWPGQPSPEIARFPDFVGFHKDKKVSLRTLKPKKIFTVKLLKPVQAFYWRWFCPPFFEHKWNVYRDGLGFEVWDNLMAMISLWETLPQWLPRESSLMSQAEHNRNLWWSHKQQVKHWSMLSSTGDTCFNLLPKV